MNNEVRISKTAKLTPNQHWVCNYLDNLNENGRLCSSDTSPSDLVKGALNVIENRESNPDWMAQSAHSYREIFFDLNGTGVKNKNFHSQIKFEVIRTLTKIGFKNKWTETILNSEIATRKDNIESVLQIINEQKRISLVAENLNKTYLAFTKISHHFSKENSKGECYKLFKKLGIPVTKMDDFPSYENFINLISVFENLLKESSLNPIEVHEKIELFLAKNDEERNAPYLRLLFSLSLDAKRFFFSQADKHWLSWLWENNFLKRIKERAEDPTQYSYRMPELEYLTRMAKKDPKTVANIINSISISKDSFNPEVIDRFLWIISALPAEQIKTLTAKVRDEEWLYLMKDFKKSGYEFEQIVQKLVEGKESSALIELAQAILATKKKEDIETKGIVFGTDDPFYVHDIYASGIFEALVDIEEIYAEKALRVATETLFKIIKFSNKDKGRVFEFEDSIGLSDVDFFTEELEGKRSSSYRGDVKNISIIFKKLFEKTLNAKRNNKEEIERLFTEHIEILPLSRSIWRLRLFALAQCPEILMKELRDAFFELFEVKERYFEIIGGAEYQKALHIGFPHLSDLDKEGYVSQVIEHFIKRAEKDPDQKWHKQYGWEILSSICEYVDGLDEKCEKAFGRKCNKDFVPEPSIGKMRGGTVQNKSPFALSDFTVGEIVENLKSKWKPEKLAELFKDDDFLNPRGAEGLGDALKEDIKKRTSDYTNVLPDFFSKGEVDSHYLYSLLRGIEEMLRNKEVLEQGQIDKIIELFKSIEGEGRVQPFEKKDDNSWLADWITVHAVIADISLHLLKNKDLRDYIYKKYREEIKYLISYLLSIKSSPSKKEESPEYGEPYGVAINSVRGRAYEAFVVFVENDGETLSNRENDVKEIYRETLKDPSIAIRFVIGRYLPSFYFRDKKFITELLPEIFPKENPEKKDLYLATWEGYLSNTLYDKLFVDLREYYEHAIKLDPKEYTDRKYFKNLDESLGIHLSLAFLHLGLEMKDSLFIAFWNTPNTARHLEFISFIGRSVLTRSEAGDEWMKKNKVDKKKIVKFWDWILENEKIKDPKVFSGFGFWINPDKEILSDEVIVDRMPQTLIRSDGDINWDYGLVKRLPTFAEKNGLKTLDVISSFLLDKNRNLNQNRRVPMFSLGNEIKSALGVIYKNGNVETKQKVTNFINELIEKGSNTFWTLKDVLKESE